VRGRVLYRYDVSERVLGAGLSFPRTPLMDVSRRASPPYATLRNDDIVADLLT